MVDLICTLFLGLIEVRNMGMMWTEERGKEPMSRKRFTELQIAFASRQVEPRTAYEEIIRKPGIGEPEYHPACSGRTGDKQSESSQQIHSSWVFSTGLRTDECRQPFEHKRVNGGAGGI